MDAEAIVGAVRSIPVGTASLVVAWVACDGVREEVAHEIKRLSDDLALVPLVVRTGGFDDPNTLSQDVLELIVSARSQLLDPELRSQCRSRGCLYLLLLGRRELGLMSTESPIALPSWFPVAAGELNAMKVIDLTWRAVVSLASREVGAGDVARLLFELEGESLRALERRNGESRRHTDRLLSLLKADDGQPSNIDAVIEACRGYRATVTDINHFRPSIRSGKSLVALLWARVNATAPDGLTALGTALADSLGMCPASELEVHQPLIAVLSRPSGAVSPSGLWGRSLLIALRSGCQLTTASAHADAYPKYDSRTVQAMSLDIRRALDAYCRDLRRLNETMTRNVC
jgi:hypothetical protein